VGELLDVLDVAFVGRNHLRHFRHGRRRRKQLLHLPAVPAPQHGGSRNHAGRGQRGDVEQQQPAEPICARANKEKQQI
jgi:hypothetical protein